MLKRVIVGGFSVGALLGSVILASSPKPALPTVAEADSVETRSEVTTPTPSPNGSSPSVQALGGPDQRPQSTFDRLVAQVAASQGGKISLRQMLAIARIAEGNSNGAPMGGALLPPVAEPPTAYGQTDSAGRLLDNMPGGTSVPSVDVDVRASEPYKFGSDPDARTYRGSSGARYHYDLSNPGDQVRYSVDVGAQVRDSVDPRVQLDRDMGQYGGGVEPPH